MKNLLLLLFSAFFSQLLSAQTISIIPEPVSVERGKGSFVLKHSTYIEISNNSADEQRVAELFSNKLREATGYPMPVRSQSGHSNRGNIRLNLTNDSTLGKEGYRLEAT